jgi:MSHA biogenesis protein MshM
MYLSHFGLDEPPFRITPHTDFFFDGANRGATLEALLYAITHDEGIVKVTGEVGSGKTMLCRVLMERLPKHVEIIYLSNPSLARDEILRAIAEELNVTVDASRATVVLRALQEHLINVHAQGHQVVVLIDEAHAMPLETLEEIRLLSNLETSRHKLLQIVLFGQPELDDNLNLSQMRQLKERITHSFRLEPLIRDDIAQYLMFRMRAAGYRGPDIFSKGAIRELARASQGLTRRINILADKSLLAAFSQNTHQVTAKQVKAAIRDSEFRNAAPRSRTPWIVALAVAAGIAIGVLSLRFFEPAEPAPAPRPQISTQAPAPIKPAPAAVQAPMESPAPAKPDQALPVNAAATPAAIALPVASGTPTTPAATSAITPAATPVAIPAAAPAPAETASAIKPTAKPAAASPPAQVKMIAEAKPASTKQEPPATPTPTKPGDTVAGGAAGSLGPLTAARMAATDAWLKDAPGRAYAIQIMAVSQGNERELEAFLARAAKLTGTDNIYVYQARIKGQSNYGLAVVYGSYPSREKVRETIEGFPAEIRTFLPYLRTVDGIRREIAERDFQGPGHT